MTLTQRLEARVAEATTRRPPGDKASDLAAEVRTLRQEVYEFRRSFIESEKKASLLMEAYKKVLSDMAGLIEAQRNESIKQQESLRFLLSSIESRIRSEMREELNGGRSGGTGGRWFSFGRR